jgi:putative endonuclease
MFSVYVLRSLKDQKFYVGQTNNLEERIRRHNEGRVPSTKGRRPFVLVWFESFESRSQAVVREQELKSLKANKRFKEIIQT